MSVRVCMQVPLEGSILGIAKRLALGGVGEDGISLTGKVERDRSTAACSVVFDDGGVEAV